MARAKATLGVGAPLSDHLGTSLLARVYPPALIEGIIRECGAQSQRRRTLPMLTLSYYCMGLSLYPECAYEALHQRACVALADPVSAPEAFYAGLRLVAIDGSHFELPDEIDNVRAFGRPGSRVGVAAYPQAQCAALVECTTHAILAAETGAYRDAEWDLCEPLLSHLNSGHPAASSPRVKMRSLSFTGNLRLIRLTQPLSGAFPASAA